MKSIKEKQLLVKWSRAMNEDIDPALLEEVERYEKLQNEIIESIRQNSIKDLAEASSVAVELVTKVQEYPKPPTLDEVLSIIQEEQNELVQSQAVEEPTVTEEAPVPEPAPTTLIGKTVDLIKTEQKSFQQPDPQPVDKNFEAVQKKLKFLEQAIGKIAATGPGGGAVWLRELNDVDYTSVRSPSDSDVLTFNASTGKWEAAAATGGSGSVPTLHQVTNRGNVTTNGITVNNANVNFLAVNTTAGFTVTEGQIAWNAADLTFDMGMANGVTLQVGQEQYIKVKAANAITNGYTVMFCGATGEHILATHCDLNSPGFRPEYFIGVATQDIAKNGFGYITTFGKVHDINTLAFQVGDILYASPSTIGGYTTTEPVAPNINIMVAAVTKRAGGDGHIMVRPTLRSRISELNDVALTNPTHGQSLVFDGGNVWRNQWLTTANVVELTNLYFTNARAVSAVTDAGITSLDNNGYTFALAADGKVSITDNIFNTGTNPVTFWSNDSVTNFWRSPTGGGPGSPLNSLISVDTNGATIALDTGVLGFGSRVTWVYDFDGSITFPDSSIQTTAFNNTAVYSNVISLGYITTSALSGYATNSQLATYATNAQLASYATNAQLTSYATTSNLALKANVVDLTTANVTEVTNLYYTNARVYSNVTQLGYITSTSLNGYATNAQLTGYATTTNVALKANITDLTTANVAELTNLYFTNARVYANVITLGYAKTANLTTANVTEVTNLYFTNARATAAVTNTTLSNISIGGFANITYQPATTSGAAINILAANTKGGTGYADILQITNTSGGAVNPNKYIRIGSFGTFEIINSAYTGMPLSLTDNGDLTVSGNVIMSGVKSGYSSARPGFRVYGAGTTNNLSTTQNSTGALNGNNWDIDFNQGSYLNDSTGVFTAPVAGLYQINVVGRNAGNASISQLAAVKNASGGTGSGGSVACMLEFGGSSSMNHAGVGTVVQLAVGDTIALKVLAGTINFDSNDNWSMAYLG